MKEARTKTNKAKKKGTERIKLRKEGKDGWKGGSQGRKEGRKERRSDKSEEVKEAREEC